MSFFITRVVLHGLEHSHAAYSTLHKAMEAAGFSRKIQDVNLNWYHLPPAEYFIDSAMSIGEVRDFVSRLAGNITAANGVLVTEGLSGWAGLLRA